MGAISTGLGEVYMWTVAFTPREQATITDGSPGWQRDGSYLTPEGQRLTSTLERNNVSTGAGYIEHKGDAYAVSAL